MDETVSNFYNKELILEGVSVSSFDSRVSTENGSILIAFVANQEIFLFGRNTKLLSSNVCIKVNYERSVDSKILKVIIDPHLKYLIVFSSEKKGVKYLSINIMKLTLILFPKEVDLSMENDYVSGYLKSKFEKIGVVDVYIYIKYKEETVKYSIHNGKLKEMGSFSSYEIDNSIKNESKNLVFKDGEIVFKNSVFNKALRNHLKVRACFAIDYANDCFMFQDMNNVYLLTLNENFRYECFKYYISFSPENLKVFLAKLETECLLSILDKYLDNYRDVFSINKIMRSLNNKVDLSEKVIYNIVQLIYNKRLYLCAFMLARSTGMKGILDCILKDYLMKHKIYLRLFNTLSIFSNNYVMSPIRFKNTHVATDLVNKYYETGDVIDIDGVCDATKFAYQMILEIPSLKYLNNASFLDIPDSPNHLYPKHYNYLLKGVKDTLKVKAEQLQLPLCFLYTKDFYIDGNYYLYSIKNNKKLIKQPVITACKFNDSLFAVTQKFSVLKVVNDAPEVYPLPLVLHVTSNATQLAFLTVVGDIYVSDGADNLTLYSGDYIDVCSTYDTFFGLSKHGKVVDLKNHIVIDSPLAVAIVSCSSKLIIVTFDGYYFEGRYFNLGFRIICASSGDTAVISGEKKTVCVFNDGHFEEYENDRIGTLTNVYYDNGPILCGSAFPPIRLIKGSMKCWNPSIEEVQEISENYSSSDVLPLLSRPGKTLLEICYGIYDELKVEDFDIIVENIPKLNKHSEKMIHILTSHGMSLPDSIIQSRAGISSFINNKSDLNMLSKDQLTKILPSKVDNFFERKSLLLDIQPTYSSTLLKEGSLKDIIDVNKSIYIFSCGHILHKIKVDELVKTLNNGEYKLGKTTIDSIITMYNQDVVPAQCPNCLKDELKKRDQ